MFRRKEQSLIKVLCYLSLSFAGGLWISHVGSPTRVASVARTELRTPANTAASNFTADQLAKAEWSVSSIDFTNSDPGKLGRSYFDAVFSKVDGPKRVYDVPYPFQKILERLNQYSGYSGQNNENAYQVVLFPMGRSLQRNAAQDDGSFDINRFFRFPRVVAGVDQEPKDLKNPLALNLKGRLYLGFHEKSKVIEAISYNDEAGRYEYQVVRNYEPGKKPQVVYEDRQKCLGCHQNQTPIFAEPLWNESNAHLSIFSIVEKQMHGAFGEIACDGSNSQPYCFTGAGTAKKYFYFGAPTRVDQAAPYALDTLTDVANYYHAYHKMWLTLCQTPECQQKTVWSVLSYLLNGRQGLYLPAQEKSNYLTAFEARFRQRFPHGMKIPQANIPNRDPLQDRQKTTAEIENSMKNIDGVIHDSFQELISRSAVSGEFEPLMVRAPAEIWMTSEPSPINMNKMLTGFADFFTAQDARVLDSWFAKKADSGNVPSMTIQGQCKVTKSDATGGFDIYLVCDASDKSSLAMESGYFPVRNNVVKKGQVDQFFLYGADSNCDWQANQSPSNRANGIACPMFKQAQAQGKLEGNQLSIQLYDQRTGLNSRLMDGRLASRLKLNIETGQVQVTISDDISLLAQSVVFPKNGIFNRKFVMKSIATSLGEIVIDSEAGLMAMEKIVEADEFTAEQIMTQYKNPVNAFYHSCGKCHHNFENVPPAFLGQKPASIDLIGRCQRIEACAPRMLYRLKMRNCSTSQIALMKKNPMPIPNFFNSTGVDPHQWQEKIAPELTAFASKLVRVDEVVKYMVAQGVDQKLAQDTLQQLTTADCPNVNYEVYENLPRCEFQNLKANSACSNLMSVFGNN